MKINDGLVLAADSASTMVMSGPTAQSSVINVYNNANKIFNLLKGKPIGVITWGTGSIGQASIATVVKDLRDRFSGRNKKQNWALNPEKYTIKEVADRFRSFIYDELYVPWIKGWEADIKPATGFIVAGYSSEAHAPEEYLIQTKADGTCDEPELLRSAEAIGATWAGQPEALNRLMTGYSADLPAILQSNLGVPAEQIPPIMAVLQQAFQTSMIMPAMPLQDAIELAEFMVETTIKYSRFSPGPSTVGGPIEIAAISKHEGFRWVKRKYYFSRELNPAEDSHADVSS